MWQIDNVVLHACHWYAMMHQHKCNKKIKRLRLMAEIKTFFFSLCDQKKANRALLYALIVDERQ